MSFAYKKIHPENITTSPYTANKQYSFDMLNISGSGVTIYFGENTINDVLNYFDPVNDSKTANNEYKRLIYDSIKHLFYKNYNNSGSLLISSSYYEYPQNTLYSGTFDTNLRRISDTKGSSFQGYNSIFDQISPEYRIGDLVAIISIDKNLYGSNIHPNTFILSSESSYIRDDGEGNIFDYSDEETYKTIIESGIPSAPYLGNIFYSLGIVTIVNQDYICLFNPPPTAINDYYTELNVSRSISFDITHNDYTYCGVINPSSSILIPIEGQNFPDSYIGPDGLLYLVDNQNSYIPGNYQIGYTVENDLGVQSNIGYVNINIIQKPLEVNNLSIEKLCSGISGSISYSFDINYGVPVYSYSFDNISYTSLPGFHNIFVSGSTNSSSSVLYIKDYINNTITTSFSAYKDPIVYNLNTYRLPSCDANASILTVTSSDASYFRIDANPTLYPITSSLPVSSGNHNVYIYGNNGCVITSSFSSSNLPPYSYNLIYSDATCNNGGIISINNFTGTYSNNTTIRVVNPNMTTASYTTSSLYLNNLVSGSYSIQTYDGYCSQTSSVLIGSFSEMVISSLADYTSSQCFSNIVLNVSGGIAPYTYKIQTPGGIYTSDTNNIQLYYDNLDPLIATASVIDVNGCTKTVYQEIYGRQYIYSGSHCETSGSGPIPPTPTASLSLISSADYTNPCFTDIILTASGGIPPYSYTVHTPESIYLSDVNVIQLSDDNLNPLIATASVMDSTTTSVITHQTVYGRQYMYSGSYCEESGSIPPPSAPYITYEIDVEDSPNCHRSVTVTVNTSTLVKIDIISGFTGGATYFSGPFTPGSIPITEDEIDLEVSSSISFCYGIDAHKTFTGTDTFSSAITIDVKDYMDSGLIDTFTFTRTHDDAEHC